MEEHRYFYLNSLPVRRYETPDFRLPLPKFGFGAPMRRHLFFFIYWVKEPLNGARKPNSGIGNRKSGVARLPNRTGGLY